MKSFSTVLFVLSLLASEGRNEMGFLVRDENVTSWFEINTTDGRIRVVRQMDREKAETIRLAIRAEDVAAATIGQTASGSKDDNGKTCSTLKANF